MTFALVHPFENWDTCRQWAVAFFAVVVVWVATTAFNRLAAVMRAGGNAGIVALELAGSRARAIQILTQWAEGGRGTTAAVKALLVDVPFLAAYGVGLALAAAVVAESARTHQWLGAADVGALVAWAFLLAAGADLVEDLALGAILFRDGDSPSKCASRGREWLSYLRS